MTYTMRTIKKVVEVMKALRCERSPGSPDVRDHKILMKSGVMDRLSMQDNTKELLISGLALIGVEQGGESWTRDIN